MCNLKKWVSNICYQFNYKKNRWPHNKSSCITTLNNSDYSSSNLHNNNRLECIIQSSQKPLNPIFFYRENRLNKPLYGFEERKFWCCFHTIILRIMWIVVSFFSWEEYVLHSFQFFLVLLRFLCPSFR